MEMNELRAEFPITETTSFMDNAAVAPISKSARAMMERQIDESATIARPAGRKWTKAVERTRVLAAHLAGCRAREIAFAGSTSMGLSLFAESLDWRVGDSVVVPSNEYPANMYAWMNLGRFGVRVKRVPPTADGRVLIEDLMAAVDSRTRVVAVSWVGFNTGYRIDLAGLGSECKKRGVHLVVDCIQGLGVFGMKLREWGVTAAAADAHKWLCGPEGVALLYVSGDVVESLHPPVVGWKSVENPMDFLHYHFRLPAEARRFEPGSANTVGIHGLLGALELIDAVGPDNITNHVKALTDYACERLGEKGIEPLSPRGGDEWSGIVSFPAPGGDGPAFAAPLEKKGVVVTGRADFVRMSPHFYNTTDDVDRLIDTL
jgi:selenocysteine lyase/cysteine desulfurase